MIEQILPGIYKIDIPLPNNPLKSTNSYFIGGHERNLLVDTGFNCTESKTAMMEALHSLGAHMETTDLFITHLHADHSGLIDYLAAPATTVWMSETDAALITDGTASSHWRMFNDFLVLSGLIAAGVENNVAKHPGYHYASGYFDKFTMVYEGYQIQVGDYSFQCVETSGHTAGHICLYEPQKRLLISGDHILGKITPNITLWCLGEDVLGNYLKNLNKIAALDVDVVLPGHRSIINDCRGRIGELEIHHDKRMDDIMNILGGATMDTAGVASRMNWDLSYKKWEDFPWGQKLFASGEALSHLYHMVVLGKLVMTMNDGIVYFRKL